MDAWWGAFVYNRNALGRIASMTDPGYPQTAFATAPTTFTWDARGLLSRQDNPYGTKATLTYDALGRTQQILHTTSAGAQIDRAFYSYDALGRPVTRQLLGGVFTWGYDALGQLTSEPHLWA